jgi:ABC-type multidrug transport system ATPase subunit
VANVLAIHDLVKRYRNGTMANAGISLDVAQGEVYGLLGPNGAGKTTLVGQVLGLRKPTTGEILLDGVDVVADPGYARRSVGFLPQAQTTMDDIHVDEFVYHIALLRGRGRAEASRAAGTVLTELQLEEFRRTPMRMASGGVRRLAGFAAAVVAPTRMLVLDEPTNDIDPIRRQLLWKAIDRRRAQGTTVLLVTHNLAEAERFIDRLAIVDRGRIVREGTPAGLRAVVTERLRLEITTQNGFQPHAALTPEPEAPGRYLFEQTALPAVSDWLAAQREEGSVVDFRIGPPTLEDIYAASVADERVQASVA